MLGSHLFKSLFAMLPGLVLGFEVLSSAPAIAREKTNSLLSVRLVPENVTLRGARSSQRFLVLGKYVDGLERDVTASSRFTIVHQEIAQLIAPGRVTARADGKTVLRVELEGQVAETPLSVQDARKERPATFKRDIESILTRRGCNGSNCH